MSQEITKTTTSSSVPILAKSGRIIGQKHVFAAVSARTVKDQLRESGLRGSELTRKVNEVLRGEKDLREQLSAAWVQATIQAGFIPDLGEVRKSSAILRFVRPRAVKEKPAPEINITREAALKALGITEQDFDLFRPTEPVAEAA